MRGKRCARRPGYGCLGLLLLLLERGDDRGALGVVRLRRDLEIHQEGG
jgi:hypothetical protein